MRSIVYWALAVIFAANFLNYTDRTLVSALEEPISRDLSLKPREYGELWSAFTIGYMVCAVPVGLMADRARRTWIFAGCIAIWSVATVASGLAETKPTLFAARFCIGAGEAGCLVLGPSLLSDYFPTRVRGKSLSVFYLGLPLGGAFAFALPLLLQGWSWRELFYLAGVPGFVVALLIAMLPEPPRGSGEGTPEQHHGVGSLVDYVRLLKTPTLLLIILAQAFAMALLAPLLHFGKEYLIGDRWLSEPEATLVMLGVLVAGIVGSLASGVLGDRLAPLGKGAYAVLAGTGYLLSFAALLIGFVSESNALMSVALVTGSLFLFLCMPAVNTQIANVTSPGQRGAAWALAVFVLHLLGDTTSPPLFGHVSEAVGREQAYLLFSLALVPAALCCFVAALTARRDAERASD